MQQIKEFSLSRRRQGKRHGLRTGRQARTFKNNDGSAAVLFRINNAERNVRKKFAADREFCGIHAAALIVPTAFPIPGDLIGEPHIGCAVKRKQSIAGNQLHIAEPDLSARVDDSDPDISAYNPRRDLRFKSVRFPAAFPAADIYMLPEPSFPLFRFAMKHEFRTAPLPDRIAEGGPDLRCQNNRSSADLLSGNGDLDTIRHFFRSFRDFDFQCSHSVVQHCGPDKSRFAPAEIQRLPSGKTPVQKNFRHCRKNQQGGQHDCHFLHIQTPYD